MVANAASPLDSYPAAATGSALNAKVASRSMRAQQQPKCKRNLQDLEVPQEVKECMTIDDDSGAILLSPTNVRQIQYTLGFASEEALSVSVCNPIVSPTHGNSRGGDIIIELSQPSFREIQVNTEDKTVTVGGGVTSRSVDLALEEKDLFTPLVGYTVGLGAFLSGGFSFSSRLHGLTVDNIIDIEMVLADGQIVHANETEHVELFWGMKGSGTAFGVVTSLTLRCFTLVRSLSATVIYPFMPENGPRLLRHWRDCLADAPNELYSNFVLAAGPEAPVNSIAILQVCHLGDQETGYSFIQRLSSFAESKPHFSDCKEISYVRQQELVEAVLKGQAAQQGQNAENQVRYLIHGNILLDLSDDVAEETCTRFYNSAHSGSIWCFEVFAGALAKVTDGCIPQSHRKGKFHAASIMRVPAEPGRNSTLDTAGKDWMREVISPVSPGGPLPSFLPTHRDDPRDTKHYHDMIRGSYGHENWSRLKTLKLTYDPQNCFLGAYDEGMLGFEEQLIDGI